MNNVLFKGAFWSFLDKIINQIGLLLVTIYLAKILGPKDFGLIGMLSVFLLIADSLVNNGFSQALIQRSKKVTDSELSTVFITNIFVAIIIYILLYLASPRIAYFYSQPELIDISRFLFLVIIINSFSIVSRAILIINMDFKSQAKSSFYGNILGASIAIISIHYNAGYWSLILMNIVKSLTVTLSLVYFSRYKFKFKFIFVYSDFKSLFSFGSKLMLAGVVATIVNNLSTILIGRYFTSKQVGYYSQSSNLTNTLSGLITSVLQGVTFPMMTKIHEERDKLKILYSWILKITMLISFPIMLGFFSIADLFTELFFGHEWLFIIPILMLLSVSRMFTPISAVNMNILNAIGRSDLFLKTDLSKLPITLISILICAPYGITWIAIGTLITNIICFMINTYYPGKLFGFGIIYQIKLAWKPLISSLFMVGVIYTINVDSLWGELIIKILIGSASYLLGLFILREEVFISLIDKVRSYN